MVKLYMSFDMRVGAPLIGGLPPDVAWESLRLFEREVLPKLEIEEPIDCRVGQI